MIVLAIIAGLIVIVGLWCIAVYNGLVGMRQSVKNAWSQIDVQLKRRHDLIPNIVETAKGYLKHENETLTNVIKARQMAVDASSVADKQAAENMLTGTLRSLMAVSEQYPDLKADQQMMKVQEELSTTENRIGFARQFYNDEVTRLNTAIDSFPDNVIANSFHFSKFDYFEIEDPQEKNAPVVKFD